MSARTSTFRTRRVVVALTLVLVATGAQHSVSAQSDLPPDDGAPPSEYAPPPPVYRDDTGVVLLPASPPPSAWRPSSPPVDNAFPIAGRTAGSCANDFGFPRGGGRTHMGIDCFAPLGTPLVAVEDGSIRYATPGEPFNCATGGDISGNRVSVRGRSGYVYYYGHLDTILVETDQTIRKGDVIGTVGQTGNASCSGPHLHFEVKCGESGDPFDPYPVVTNWGRVTRPATTWPSTDAFGVGVAYSGTSRQDMVALECGEAIRQMSWHSSSGLSSAWAAIDGIASSDPDVATPWGGGTPRVVARGTDSAAWLLDAGGWTSLGGVCSSAPSAVYTSTDRLDVVCRGTDMALWHRVWDRGSGWSSGWFRIGGAAASAPEAVSPGPQYPFQVFARGTDNAVWQLVWVGSRWAAVSLGGVCTSGPSAAYSGADRLDVFCRGTDLAIWHRFWNRSTGWSPHWTRIDSISLSDPEAASSGPGGVAHVFARGLDRRIYDFWWDGTTWASRIWGVT